MERKKEWGKRKDEGEMGKKRLNKKEERGEREKGRGVEEDGEGYIGGKEREEG